MNEIVIRIEGLDQLTEALRALAGSQVAREPQQAPSGQMPTMSAPVPGTQMPQPAFCSQIPVQPMAPVPVPTAQQPVSPAPVSQQQNTSVPTQAPQVPTTAAPQQYSFDQLAVALANVCMRPDGQAKVQALLQQFGVNALFDLPKDRFGEFATALRGIGGVI